EPRGPWARPGAYTVWLTVAGLSYTQPLIVKMDPRVTTPAEGLERQFTLSMQCYDGVRDARAAAEQIRKLRAQVRDRRAQGRGGRGGAAGARRPAEALGRDQGGGGEGGERAVEEVGAAGTHAVTPVCLVCSVTGRHRPSGSQTVISDRPRLPQVEYGTSRSAT